MAHKKSRAETYLERAREADQKAVETKDYVAGEIWKQVAETYRRLAKAAEEGY